MRDIFRTVAIALGVCGLLCLAVTLAKPQPAKSLPTSQPQAQPATSDAIAVKTAAIKTARDRADRAKTVAADLAAQAAKAAVDARVAEQDVQVAVADHKVAVAQAEHRAAIQARIDIERGDTSLPATPNSSGGSSYRDMDSNVAPPKEKPEGKPGKAVVKTITAPNAKVFIQGQEIPSYGKERTFTTPVPGEGKYTLDVEVVTIANGKSNSDKRQVTVQIGETTVADFTR